MNYADFMKQQERMKALEARVADLEAQLAAVLQAMHEVPVKRPVGRPRKVA